MQFTLFYMGKLRANGGRKHKQEIRRQFQIQLRELWEVPPLKDRQWELLEEPSPGTMKLIEVRGPFRFAPLVSRHTHLSAKLKIVMLRPGEPGSLIARGGDLDNRLKTLLDALRMPDENQLVDGDSPTSDEKPFFCLLQDDILVTDLAVETDRLLQPGANATDVIALIHVHAYPSTMVMGNIDLM